MCESIGHMGPISSYRMPGEWERHKATWLAWPYGEQSFEGCIPQVEQTYTRIIAALSPHETVRIILRGEQKEEVASKLSSAGIDLKTIDFLEADYTDVWARDWGPSFAEVDRKKGFIKWTYNAYGNKFEELLKDNTVVDQVPYLRDFVRVDAGLVLEGGAIEPNGVGVVLTSEETLLNLSRNPGMSRGQIEAAVGPLIGASRWVWLKRGLINDHTDGHIDEIARFTSLDTIVYAWEEKGGPNHEILADNLATLQKAVDQGGKPFRLVPLPIPSMTFSDGEPAPTSYCNFYIANNVVLVPQFNHPNDAQAMDILRSVFPDRHPIGVDSTYLLFGGGSPDQGGGGIHCITQQEPAFG